VLPTYSVFQTDSLLNKYIYMIAYQICSCCASSGRAAFQNLRNELLYRPPWNLPQAYGVNTERQNTGFYLSVPKEVLCFGFPSLSRFE